MNLIRKTLLVIAPHPDDEVLGAAGLIQQIKKSHGKVYVLYLTVGATEDYSRTGKSSGRQRITEIKKVANLLKFDDYDIAHNGNFHLKLDTLGQMEVMQVIERKSRVALEKVKPDIVAFPSLYSYNQDHQLAARATHASLRPADSAVKHFVPQIIAYEVPADSWSMHRQSVPNIFTRLTAEEFTVKKRAMSLYTSQMRPWPNPRSLTAIEALARLRGAHVSAGYAEGFIGFRILL